MGNIKKAIDDLRNLHLSYGEYPISFLFQKYREEEKYELCHYTSEYSKLYDINLEMDEDDFIQNWIDLGSDYKTAKFILENVNTSIYIAICDKHIQGYDKLAEDL